VCSQKHLLARPSLLDPFWFNKMRRGPQEAIVIDQQTIEVHDLQLRLAHPEEIQLVPSEKVFVTCLDNFYLETEREWDERAREATERQAQEAERTRAGLNRIREEAETFNAALTIPVAWKPGYKSVLSGLSITSWGDGRNRATVEHIWLLDELHEGKLHRKRGDFLCSSSSGSNGEQWVSPESICRDGDGNDYVPKVTCQSCLKIARRWVNAR
jgi:hypothetical protein